MYQKKELLELLLPGTNVSKVCNEYGVSRKTAYKWLKHYKTFGLEVLQE